MSVQMPSAFRAAFQVLLIGVLIAGAYSVGALSDDNTRKDNAVATFEGLLAETCNAATLRELRANDLLAECQLAQQEELAEQVIDAAPATPQPTPPAADVVPDRPSGLSEAEQAQIIEDAVDDYFTENPLPDPQYEQRISAAVTTYLENNPPTGLAPTQLALRRAVRTFLLANPPADGTDGAVGAAGADGRGVAAAATDGCDVVFTYSDGSTDRVGPLCGPPPTEESIRGAVNAYCEANPDDCRGPAGPAGPAGPTGVVDVEDACDPPDGTVVVDVNVIYQPEQRTIRVECETAPGFPGGGGGQP